MKESELAKCLRENLLSDMIEHYNMELYFLFRWLVSDVDSLLRAQECCNLNDDYLTSETYIKSQDHLLESVRYLYKSRKEVETAIRMRAKYFSDQDYIKL